MTQPRASAEYGVSFLYNPIPIGDPRGAESFTQHNRLGDDCAQMTRVAMRSWVRFPVLASGTIVNASGKSQMGTGTTDLPTITRTGTGAYTITYPVSWIDNAGTDGTGVGQLELINYNFAVGAVQSLTAAGHIYCLATNNVIHIVCRDKTDAAVDFTDGTLVVVMGY